MLPSKARNHNVAYITLLISSSKSIGGGSSKSVTVGQTIKGEFGFHRAEPKAIALNLLMKHSKKL
jgi:hypothetical protein